MQVEIICLENTNITQDSTKNGELTDLLIEAKATILQLQAENKSLNNEIQILRQQNLDNVKRNESLQEGNHTEATQLNDIEPPPIPLEPVIIVKENGNKIDATYSQNMNAKNQGNDTGANPNDETDNSERSHHSSQSDNTYHM